MELTIIKKGETNFKSKDLQSATERVFKLGEEITNNWYGIASTIATIDNTNAYKEDGFKTVHEWVTKTFGLQKSSSYTLLKIGKEYTTMQAGEDGIEYKANIQGLDGEEFSKTQVERMLPLGHDKAEELVASGKITPKMSTREISDIVKKTLGKDKKNGIEVADGVTVLEDKEITVTDENGKKWKISRKLFEKYAKPLETEKSKK